MVDQINNHAQPAATADWPARNLASTVLAHSSDWVCVLDAAARQLDCNAVGLHLTGGSADAFEISEGRWLQLWRGEDQAGVAHSIRQAFASGAGEFSARLMDDAHSSQAWHFSLTRVQAADDPKGYVVCIGRPVAVLGGGSAPKVDRSANPDGLEARVQYALNRHHVDPDEIDGKDMAILEISTKDLCVLAANDAAVRIYGAEREMLLGHSLLAFAPAGAEALSRQTLEAMLASPYIANRLRQRGHNKRLIHVNLTACAPDALAPERRLVLVSDVTEQVEARQELERQQELNRLLLENLSEGVVACDQNQKLILFNKVAREWHGTDPRAVGPEKWAEYYDLYEGDGTTVLKIERIPLVRAFNGETVRNAKMCITRKNQEPRYILASGGPLFDSGGNKIGAVVAMTDMTEMELARRELQQFTLNLQQANARIEHDRSRLASRVRARTAELEKLNLDLERARADAETASKAKTAFLAMMSHEIRTPMNGIVGMIDVLASDQLDDGQQSAIRMIRVSATTLLRIIDDILDFSKIEAGRLELETLPVAVDMVVADVCTALHSYAQDNKVDIVLDVDDDLASRYWTDATRVYQILNNLIGNAIKFSGNRPDRFGEVYVRVKCDEPRGVWIEIRDNGIGIDADEAPRLFESFSQAESSTTRRFGGTGLGLAISHRLVSMMYGRIEVESEIGKGACFTIHLPLDEAPGEPEDRPPDLSGMRFQVFEKSSVQKPFRRWLAETGAKVLSNDGDLAAGAIRIELSDDDQKAVMNRLSGLDNEAGERYLLIARAGNRHPEMIAHNVMLLNRDLVTRRDFWLASAIVSGVQSPKTQNVHEDLSRSCTPPDIDKARDDGRLVLIVEDDAINQAVLLRQLHALGYAADLAGSAEEALSMWQRSRYGMLLTDLHMPGMDGCELTKRIRALDGNGIPIVVASANVMAGEAERAKQAGVDAFLHKPLRLSRLRKVMQRLLPAPAVVPQTRGIRELGAIGDLDIAKLAEVVGYDAAMIDATLDDFASGFEPAALQLIDALAREDTEQVLDRVHRLKASLGTVGAETLAARCAELEERIRRGQGVDYHAAAAALDPAFKALMAALQQYRSGRPPVEH